MSELIDRADAVYEDIKGVPYKARVVIRELAGRVEAAEAKLAEARNQRALAPGYVWQDYYSPDDVLRIRQEIEAQRDAALAKLAAVEAAVSGHPKCDLYDDDDAISCGWKSAYRSVLANLGLPAGGENDGE